MLLLKILLLPFSFLYLLGVSFRNYLYDKRILKSFRFSLPLIGVGNLRVGGTGKTPHVEYLTRLLQDQFKLAILSRGYGRKTRGFVLADDGAASRTIGDEPLQFYLKFRESVAVAVGEDRAMAIPLLLSQKPEVNLILLDDAFQHRSVRPDINILLSEYGHPFYTDFVLPSGRLREGRSQARRADMILITKCPDALSGVQMQEVLKEVRKYAPGNIPVFFTGLKYMAPLPLFHELKKAPGHNVLLVTGIARSAYLVERIKKEYNLLGHLAYPDHFNYTQSAVEDIIKQFEKLPGNDKSIIVTEKDMVKLKDPAFKALLSEIPVFYLPIEIYFLQDKHKFEDLIVDTLQKKQSEEGLEESL